MALSLIVMVLVAVGLPEPTLNAPPAKIMRECGQVRQSVRAIKACSRLILRSDGKSNQHKAKIYTRRGQAFALLKRYKKAEGDFSKAIKIRPQFVEAWFHRAAVRSRSGQHDKAIADYTQVITLKPDFAMPYYNRGTAYARKKMYPNAIADFSTMIGLTPNFWQAYINRGAIYSKTKQFGKALYDYDMAYKINPTEHSVLINRAVLNLKVGRKRHAYHDYKIGLKLPSNHDHIKEVQLKMQHLGFYQGAINGIFDVQTDQALQKWLLKNKESNNEK